MKQATPVATRAQRRLAPVTTCALALVLVVFSLVARSGIAAAEGGGTVYVHLHPCSDPAMTRNFQDYNTLLSLCQDNAVYFSFSLTTEGVTYKGQEVSGSPLEQTFSNIPAHIFTIEGQSVPFSGEPVVYCQNGDGSSSGAYVRMEVGPSGGSFAVHPTMGASGYIVCDWFAGAPDPSVDTSGSLTIHQHACPNGVDLINADAGTLPANCFDQIVPATLTVTSNLNQPSSQMTGNQIWDGAYWQFLSPDFVQISSDAQSSGRVFCKGGGYPLTEIPAQQNTFAYNLVSGEHLVCDWYTGLVMAAQQQQQNQDAQPTADAANGDKGNDQANSGDQQQSGGVGAISITVYTCPAGFDPTTADFSSLQASCQEGGNGFDFTLSAGDSVSTETSGQYVDQGVYWDGIGAGDVVMQESIPAGYGSPFFSCPGWNGVAGDGSIVLTVNDGETLSCDWFNTQP